jgi:hypothetical protein
LSGIFKATGREVSLRSLALGSVSNFLPARGLFIVSESFPAGVDGVLDPTESYWPLGYTIDLPRGEITSFDPQTNPLRPGDAARGGTVVTWLFDSESRRPYVLLGNGSRALIDTGSGFGLAIGEGAARSFGAVVEGREDRGGARDIGGGRIASQRVRPVSVRVGALELRRVPTDVLSGVGANSPVLLGRRALEPFRLSFDPLNRLIKITPPPDD